MLAAHDIVNTLSNLGFSCTIGLTSGPALCSSVGGLERREYTMMGSVVNRAARLMQAARQQQIPLLCDGETAAACRERITFNALPPLHLRGISDPVTVFQPVLNITDDTNRQLISKARYNHAFVGRTSEMALLLDRLDRLQRGQSGGVMISGEAGIGKSHLVQEFLNQARAQNTVILSATARAIDRSPYHTIRSGLLELLNDVRLAVLSDDIYHISRQLWP